MENLTPIAAARRNLAQRLERFLAAKRESVLTAGEATNIEQRWRASRAAATPMVKTL